MYRIRLSSSPAPNRNQVGGLPAENYLDMTLPFFRRSNSQRRIEDAIRRGVGVTEFSWLAPAAGDPDARRSTLQSILDSVREAMAAMHRPYGIDHVALALACRDHGGHIVCSNTLGVIRPASFYGPEGEARIGAFLDDIESIPAANRAWIDGALLSVGDLAFELTTPKAA